MTPYRVKALPIQCVVKLDRIDRLVGFLPRGFLLEIDHVLALQRSDNEPHYVKGAERRLPLSGPSLPPHAAPQPHQRKVRSARHSHRILLED